MKKILLLFVVCSLLLPISCSDMLNVEPENAVTYTNFFKNEQDLESLTTGMHALMLRVIGSFWVVEYAGVKSDKSPTGRVALPAQLMRYHMWNDQVVTWKPFYDAIYQCNMLFDNVEHPVCPPDRMNFYFGQANFVKSVCYFQLARYWGDAVITGHTEDPSGRGKKPASEVLDTALSCALRAYDLLPVYDKLINRAGAKINSKQYGCKGSAATLLANIYAWKASVIRGLSDVQRREYRTEAEKWASKVIDTEECGHYELESSAKDLIENTINRRGGKESIFELEMNSKDGNTSDKVFTSARFFVTYPIIPGKLPGDVAKMDWAMKLQTVISTYPGNDERRNAFFYKPDVYNSDPDSARICKGWAYPYKFRESTYSIGTTEDQTLQFVNFNTNRIIWRLADLILLRAEVRAQLGDRAGAIADLQRIQGRACAALYDGSEDLQLAIFREREKELVFEDQRWFDVMRNEGYYKTELPKNKIIIPPPPFPREEEEEVYSLLTEQDIADGALYLPISSAAFNLNSMMIQNSYWFNR